MQAPPQLSYEDYCRIIGELYLDAHLRIKHLEQKTAASNPLPLVQSLQGQLERRRQENEVLHQNLENVERELAELKGQTNESVGT
jgi:hypothetical protein